MSHIQPKQNTRTGQPAKETSSGQYHATVYCEYMGHITLHNNNNINRMRINSCICPEHARFIYTPTIKKSNEFNSMYHSDNFPSFLFLFHFCWFSIIIYMSTAQIMGTLSACWTKKSIFKGHIHFLRVAFTPMSKEDFTGRSSSKVGYFLFAPSSGQSENDRNSG